MRINIFTRIGILGLVFITLFLISNCTEEITVEDTNDPAHEISLCWEIHEVWQDSIELGFQEGDQLEFTQTFTNSWFDISIKGSSDKTNNKNLYIDDPTSPHSMYTFGTTHWNVTQILKTEGGNPYQLKLTTDQGDLSWYAIVPVDCPKPSDHKQD